MTKPTYSIHPTDPADVCDPPLTVKETATRLAVSEKTIRRMLARGELPCLRIRRAVRIPAGPVFALAKAWQFGPYVEQETEASFDV